VNTGALTRVTISIVRIPGYILLLTVLVLSLAAGGCQQHRQTTSLADESFDVVCYDERLYPNVYCLAGRVLAETDPALSVEQRAKLWADYGLELTWEWVIPRTGYTYHELRVKHHGPLARVKSLLAGKRLASRELCPLVEELSADERVTWAAPDALLWEWCDGPELPAGEELVISAVPPQGIPEPAEYENEDGPVRGVSLLAPPNSIYPGTVAEWVQIENAPTPFPDFEYYHECSPEGTAVNWAPQLKANADFMERYGVVYGTGQAKALREYRSAGSPTLSPVTICVADTGTYMNHPEMTYRLHPNAIDANYTAYEVAGPGDRAGIDAVLGDRKDRQTIGLPRPAIQGRPASHGTAVQGILERCVAGFDPGAEKIRLLPVSVKSEKTIAIVGFKIKTPISATIKMINCLYDHFPTGYFTPEPDDPVQNTGDVRVVSMSASVSRADFSEMEWDLATSVVGKAIGTISEDLRKNDRTYCFASGNNGSAVPGKPSDEDYVIGVAATMPFKQDEAWHSYKYEEGANMGMGLVSAPGYAIITSTIYPCPNLEYLDEREFRSPLDAWSIPAREGFVWREQTNHFSATSSATPQVAALAALLLAQHPERNYLTVKQLIVDSTGDRVVSSDWGKARGLIDYSTALNWSEYYGGE